MVRESLPMQAPSRPVLPVEMRRSMEQAAAVLRILAVGGAVHPVVPVAE
jgi:hypothetical protein